MDAAAITLARDSNIPILVFDIHAPGSFGKVIAGLADYIERVSATTRIRRAPA